MKIVMYTKNNCPNCNRAKFMLSCAPIDVEVIERNIDEDENAKVECVDILESKTLPTLIFDSGKDNQRVYRGWEEHFGKIQEELGI